MVWAALVGAAHRVPRVWKHQQTASGLVESLGKFVGSPHLVPLGVGPQPVGVEVFGYQPKV